MAPRAPRNRTLTLSEDEREHFAARLLRPDGPLPPDRLRGRTIHADLLEIQAWLPESFADLVFLDPPYNLSKTYGARSFRRLPPKRYAAWVERWLPGIVRTLQPTASLYFCADWRTSPLVYPLLARHLIVRSRITWEREKGRGARRNWKNASEDIWFCTRSDDYTFNVDAVKLRRRVHAPYRSAEGEPKDWQHDEAGRFRLTHPSNLWTDLSVPFWSMPENTDHPAQKPEKLLARVILASSSPDDLVFDPFLGSGTTSVAARKLGRHYVGVEIDETYCCLAEKRLALADQDPRIQGYHDGMFWERGSQPRR